MAALVFAAIWIACGVLHYGLFVGYFQREYPTIAKEELASDRRQGAFLSLAGPCALIAGLIFLGSKNVGFRHGLKF